MAPQPTFCFPPNRTMRRILPLATVAFATACLGHPLTAPAPMSFHSARSARDATRGAVLALVNAGFRVTQTDSMGMAVNATRTATHSGNAEFVTCQLPKESAAAVDRETTLQISFRAVPAPQGEGSEVTIASKVTTAYPGYDAATIPVGDASCVSSGTMEQRLQTALR